MDSNIRVLIVTTFLLLASGLVTLYWSSRPDSPEQVAERVTARLEQELGRLDEQAFALIEELKANPGFGLPLKTDFSFYVISNYKVVQWNDHHFVPSVASVQDDFSLKLLKD